LPRGSGDTTPNWGSGDTTPNSGATVPGSCLGFPLRIPGAPYLVVALASRSSRDTVPGSCLGFALRIPGAPYLVRALASRSWSFPAMARLARVVAPRIPHQISRRGNRRQPTFFCGGDDQCYLELMAQLHNPEQVEIWAYCLMPNHVHLIAVPQSADGLRQAIGEAHRRYTRRGNFSSDPLDWRRLGAGKLAPGRFSPEDQAVQHNRDPCLVCVFRIARRHEPPTAWRLIQNPDVNRSLTPTSPRRLGRGLDRNRAGCG